MLLRKQKYFEVIIKNKRKAIMLRSRLKNISNKTKNADDILKYKKQRNIVIKLNKEQKEAYFNNCNLLTSTKPFWDKCKPYFSNKHKKGTGNILYFID